MEKNKNINRNTQKNQAERLFVIFKKQFQIEKEVVVGMIKTEEN